MEHASNVEEQVAISNKQAKEKIALNDCLKRLTKNSDFRTVVMDHYLKEYPATLVALKAEPSQQGAEDQKAIDNAIIAVGEIQQFFRSIIVNADMARKALDDNARILEESLEEEV